MVTRRLCSKAYGALATPHIFVFDRERKLRYQGQFDDSRFPDPATVKTTDGPNAVRALLAGSAYPLKSRSRTGVRSNGAKRMPL